jgi:hypothetical protein
MAPSAAAILFAIVQFLMFGFWGSGLEAHLWIRGGAAAIREDAVDIEQSLDGAFDLRHSHDVLRGQLPSKRGRFLDVGSRHIDDFLNAIDHQSDEGGFPLGKLALHDDDARLLGRGGVCQTQG